MTSMNDRLIQTTPLVYPNAEADSFGGHSQHGRVMTDKDDSSRGRDGSFNDTDNVWDGETVEQRPQREILKASR